MSQYKPPPTLLNSSVCMIKKINLAGRTARQKNGNVDLMNLKKIIAYPNLWTILTSNRKFSWEAESEWRRRWLQTEGCSDWRPLNKNLKKTKNLTDVFKVFPQDGSVDDAWLLDHTLCLVAASGAWSVVKGSDWKWWFWMGDSAACSLSRSGYR